MQKASKANLLDHFYDHLEEQDWLEGVDLYQAGRVGAVQTYEGLISGKVSGVTSGNADVRLKIHPAGHCIQCDTAKIAYQLRNSASGYVYLAYSKSTKLSKVGFSKHHPQDRGEFLRKEAYGNIRDWDIKNFVQLPREAGKKEFEIHAALEKFRKSITYEKNRGQFVECYEIFNCDLEIALDAFLKHTRV